MDNELLLYDRLNVIKDTINKYGADNFYISFSGGKDSTVLHCLIDMALPGNTIPRVFINTGIEYTDIVKFVRSMAEKDSRIEIVNAGMNIKQMLEKYGYPFKSKRYAYFLAIYQKNAEMLDKAFAEIEKNPDLLNDYDYLHNLSLRSVVEEVYGVREKSGKLYQWQPMPKILRYQFSQNFKMKISDRCCIKMKEETLSKWSRRNKRKSNITAIMAEEGGRRAFAKCIIVKNKKVVFNPMAKVNKDWEQWFIDKYNIQLCKLYYEPYNFKRTGCKGCPFALNLQEQLETMEKYLPNERKQCEIIWKPVYDEYRRIGYRLKKDEQLKLF